MGGLSRNPSAGRSGHDLSGRADRSPSEAGTRLGESRCEIRRALALSVFPATVYTPGPRLDNSFAVRTSPRFGLSVESGKPDTPAAGECRPEVARRTSPPT